MQAHDRPEFAAIMENLRSALQTQALTETMLNEFFSSLQRYSMEDIRAAKSRLRDRCKRFPPPVEWHEEIRMIKSERPSTQSKNPLDDNDRCPACGSDSLHPVPHEYTSPTGMPGSDVTYAKCNQCDYYENWCTYRARKYGRLPRPDSTVAGPMPAKIASLKKLAEPRIRLQQPTLSQPANQSGKSALQFALDSDSELTKAQR